MVLWEASHHAMWKAWSQPMTKTRHWMGIFIACDKTPQKLGGGEGVAFKGSLIVQIRWQ